MELKDKLLEGTYVFCKNGLYINAKIHNVIEQEDKITLFFYDGSIDVYIDHIEEIKEPKCIWCYKIKNYLGQDMGFINKLKE